MKKLLATSILSLLLSTSALAETSDKTTSWEKARETRMEEMLSKLPEEKAAIVRESMEKQRADDKASQEKIQNLYLEARELLAAKKFNKEAYLAKIQEINERQSDKHMAKAESIADLASKLSPEERQLLAESFGGQKKLTIKAKKQTNLRSRKEKQQSEF